MPDAKQAGGRQPGESAASRHPSAGMRLELQTNQTVLDGLLSWYSVFAFTGGAVPSGQCELAAVDDYLERPFATDCISTDDVARYRRLIASIMKPSAEISVRPRTLRGRKQISDTFSRAAAEIRTLGNTLQAALTIQDQSVSV